MKLSSSFAPRCSPRVWARILLCAAGIWLGFPNDVLHIPPLALFWPVSLTFMGFAAASRANALLTGWLATLTGSMAALYWLVLPVYTVGGLPLILAVPCALFIATCISFAGGLFAMAAYELRMRPRWLSPILLGLCWYLLEEVGALALGFPWLTMGGALAAWPCLVQFTDTVGAYALAGIWTMTALWCCLGLIQIANDKKAALPCLAAGLATTVLLLTYGTWRLHSEPFTVRPESADSFDTLFVEGNVDQNQKWLPAFQQQTVNTYLNLTVAALQQKPEAHPLIIWPETALPFFFETNRIHTPRIRQLAAKSQSLLLLGAPGRERRMGQKEPDIYNRAFLLGPDGETIGHYDKEHLVPFGEYLPSWLAWDFLEALLQGVGVYREGTATAPIRYGNLALGMLICYEGIFPWLAQERVADGANVLVDMSNDGWFADTPAPRQHLYLTVLRALEQNRWILRGTNTGISAVVDTRGRLALRGEQFREQAIWGRARMQTGPSLFHKISPWLPFAASGLLIALWGLSRRSTFAHDL